MREPKEVLQDKVGGIINLPTLPSIAGRLLRTINSADSSAQEVAGLICQDPSLSAKVLRLANSAFYGMPRTITSISNAVVILGLKVINTLVLSLTVFDMFPERCGGRLFNREAFWRHSLGCALIAKMLARKMQNRVLFDEEVAFCAGLLHDIGKVVMEQYLHPDFHSALQHAQDTEMPMHEAEFEMLGYMHTDVAEWLTANWKLPGEIHHPLYYHHAPHTAPEHTDIVALCHFADILTYELGLKVDEKYAPPQLVSGSLDQLEDAAAAAEAIKADFPSELRKIESFTAAARQH
ncbi:MAG: HDOD domain-containing protein [Chitinivibrionales bacterium]|nr:HDOD domain-containing protein [Chitinivibrionales bacterium]